MSFGQKILEYKDEILKDLDELLRIRSVYSESPQKCKEALNWMLKKAEDFGLVTKNIDNKAGHAQLGSEGKLCATLTHLDVVPAGDNWTCEPFELTIKDGKYLGRGVLPFNLIKVLLVSAITMFIYKPLSMLIKGINNY